MKRVTQLGGFVFAVFIASALGAVFTQSWLDGGRFAFGQAASRQAAVADLSRALTDVSARLRPSVVSIHSITEVMPEKRQRVRPDVPEEFRRFFDDDSLDFFFDQQPNRGYRQRGLGSGVIVDRQGYIVTNNHVVRNATQVQVTLDNGKTYDAKVVGSDAKTDLAVLKIEATGLRAAPLGDSDQVEVGEWVLAIGSPFEYAQTVTAGIVSAKGRSMRVLADVQGYEDFIQTDAAINPGNSGGPLINLRGEVIGINTAIASRSGGFNGLGFSIPSNMVRSIKDAIMRDGKVRRGQLGTQIGDLSEALAASFGYPSTNGALVSDVVPGSAAEKAGIKHDDIIVAFNGQKIKDVKQLRFAVAATTPGTRTQLQVFRDGKTVSLEVVLEQQSDQRTATNKPRESKRDREENVAADLGLVVEAISPDTAAQLGLRDNEKGVVVTEVQVNRLAARVGLQKGDVILSVGEIATPTPQAYKQATKALNQQRGIRIRMLRNGARLYLFLQDR